MAHYAIIDPATNLVVTVHVGRDEHDLIEGVDDWESYYAPPNYLCRRTSYNTVGGQHLLGGTPFRKNFAGVGFTFDKDRDAFIPVKPFESWLLNEETCLWEPPVPRPETGDWEWVEEELAWVEIE